MNNTTTFETAKVGDRVWAIPDGWGEITDISDYYDYPLSVRFDSGASDCFTFDGRVLTTHSVRSLFWDEVEAPTKPLPKLEVDTQVIVWNEITPKTKRHFSHFTPTGKIVCFANGMTSWTTKQTNEWVSWELAE